MDEAGLLIKGSVHTSQVIMICRLDPEYTILQNCITSMLIVICWKCKQGCGNENVKIVLVCTAPVVNNTNLVLFWLSEAK